MDGAESYFLQLGTKIAALAPKLLTALIVFAAFWLVAKLIARILRSIARELDDDQKAVLLLISRTVKVTLLMIGVFSALSAAGLNVTTAVAGLGLTGFALGFALKDALSNLLAGVLIFFYQPFKRGQRIIVSGFEGQVSNINLRYTTLENEGKTILVPNSQIFTNTITLLKSSAEEPATPAKEEQAHPPDTD